MMGVGGPPPPMMGGTYSTEPIHICLTSCGR
jgi:hypothetical protein